MRRLKKVLVLLPIPEEMNFFLRACAELNFRAHASVLGRISVTDLPELGLTVGCGGLGKAQFGIQTQHLIDVGRKWDLVLCAGAAGALDEALSAGDVVIATETVEHDIYNLCGKTLVPRFRNSEKFAASLQRVSRKIRAFRSHRGPIASGDEDIVDARRRKEIRQLTGALAVAWEGAGGARACQFSGVPYLEIRGVTDGANRTAASDFRTNLKRAMSNVALLVTRWAKQRMSRVR